ncbi:MAG TPA: 50S ribosomal protein L21 [Candidatus Acidoferrales bacterium]|nr:50S ribosomal protein L21 [Candidatus Acidoferrales bacterium]
MLAVVEIAGKQFKIAEDVTVKVPRLDAKVGDKIKFDKVLLVEGEKAKSVGSSYVKGALVEATIIDHDRDDKIIVFRKKRRKNFKVKKGHRQEYTTIHIDSITQSR